jgi:hypothetical protein
VVVNLRSEHLPLRAVVACESRSDTRIEGDRAVNLGLLWASPLCAAKREMTDKDPVRAEVFDEGGATGAAASCL